MKYPNVFVIVVTYNGMKWLDRCFGSIAASTIPLHTVVVDNGSEDGTVDALKERFPMVNVIETGENLGFGRANNIGMRHALDAGCDYVYLLNQDAWIDPDAIEKMVEIQREHPNYHVLSPVQMETDRVSMNSLFEILYTGEWNHAKPAEGEISSPELYGVDFMMAAHWFMTRECLEVIGGFAPIFPHYGEDDNYAHRLKYHGLKMGVCTGVIGIHDVGKRVRPPRHLMWRFYIGFLIRACDITRGAWKAWLSAIWRISRESVRNIFRYKSLYPVHLVAKAFWVSGEIVRTRKQTKKTGRIYL